MSKSCPAVPPTLFVSRGGADIECIRPPSGFAWEILRRRSDYAGQTQCSVERTIGAMGQPIDIVTGSRRPNAGGLLFR